jgi:hypothetical protein
MAESTRGGGSKASGGTSNSDSVAPLQHHAQAPEVLAARRGGHAVDHLLLQHEDLVADPGGHRQQVEQDGCGDVVGQVAHDAQRRPGHVGQRADVHLQHVGLDHRHAGTLAPARGQVAVQLDHRQRPAAFQQRLGHRTEAGADLDDRLARLRADRPHDAVDHHRVGQEVLAEALARDVAQTGGSRSST